MTVFVHVNDCQNIKVFIQEHSWVGILDYAQLTYILDEGLFAYNKSQESSLPFLMYNRFVILGTLGMSEHGSTQSVKTVIVILNFGDVYMKKQRNLN